MMQKSTQQWKLFPYFPFVFNSFIITNDTLSLQNKLKKKTDRQEKEKETRENQNQTS